MAADDPSERVIAGRFQPTDLIGTGGFGEVWKGEDKKMKSTVAIKLPSYADGGFEEDVAVSRFRQEWKILDRLEQAVMPSSIVRSLATGNDSDPYSVFEYINGVKLDVHLQRNNYEPGCEVLRKFAVPVLRAIEFLHRNNIAYLDLKPENILVRSNSEQPVLIDFNTAVVGDETRTLFNRDDFKAPEQIKGTVHEYTTPQCADIYSAGKLIYYLLSGETEINGSSPPRAGEDVARAAGLPERVASIIKRSLVVDPKHRLDNIRVIMDEIYRLLEPSSETQNIGILEFSDGFAECPARPGDCVGRISDGQLVPSISITDPDQYISPQHFSIDQDEKSWILRDHSLNGTYVWDGSTWQFIISSDGYNRLLAQAPEQVPDSPPPDRLRVYNDVCIRPVSKNYNSSIVFHTQ